MAEIDANGKMLQNLTTAFQLALERSIKLAASASPGDVQELEELQALIDEIQARLERLSDRRTYALN